MYKYICKIIKNNFNFIIINNYYNNYNKIIYNNKIKIIFLNLKIPFINNNCKIDKIISSIKSNLLDKIYCFLEKSIEIYIFKIQTINFFYEEVTIPLIINYSNLLYSGQIPSFYNNLFIIEKNKFLIPTSEVILNSLLFFVKKNIFPIKIICNSYCFRKEIGKFGKENSGLKRQQQFKKIEIFQFFYKNNSLERFYSVCSNIIFILNKFKIKFRIIKINSLELNKNSFLSFDIEVFDYYNNIWLELSSISLCINNPFLFYLKKNNYLINASCLPLGRLIYLIFLYYRINNFLVKIPKIINKILTELLKW
ncbi:seryl-tRNA synthetase [Candidatus Carsonella ruddii HT isolate Thao2000]|uniref:Seryl-tRNA(Ser/Sec) synthetase n=1 Tax=Candidatus Carsonella ruddii HT isolate Thao2000 TaxID=1202539 RepID=J3TWB1_CARRU|nr:aminoacyl--tRNA ligase-related protein [Candidatus Carsonella ruddii]AFP84130.1 seryl-tRNA synthetase [Candidatus Carsonella ruddii HT isolate Thao2000]